MMKPWVIWWWSDEIKDDCRRKAMLSGRWWCIVVSQDDTKIMSKKEYLQHCPSDQHPTRHLRIIDICQAFPSAIKSHFHFIPASCLPGRTFCQTHSAAPLSQDGRQTWGGGAYVGYRYEGTRNRCGDLTIRVFREATIKKKRVKYGHCQKRVGW